MQRKFFSAALTLAGVLLGSTWAVAAKGPAYLTVAEAGPDFKIQGEYAGKAGNRKLGAQVIALGDGKFQAVFLPGGLPGAGWDGSLRVRVDGQADGSSARFGTSGSGWNGVISGEQFQGTTDSGQKFSLKKVLRKSKTLGEKPPAGARVLFDGKNTDAWVNGRITPEGLLMEGTQTKDNFEGVKRLHLEFMTSFMPTSRGQARANSGLFMDGRYEVQILDSFGLEGENNECGGIYTVKRPDVNMAFPPLSWQTYDVEFTPPTFNAQGVKVKNAVITVYHNGVLIHDKVEVLKHTAGGQEGPKRGPIVCMNHGDPIRFRNIWVVEK